MANDPGWYADPWRPGRRRWWDGREWTDHTYDPDAPVPPEAMPAGPAPTPPAPPSWQQQWQPVVAWQPINPTALAQVEIDAERRMAVWAKRAFIAIAIGTVLGGVVAALTFHEYAEYLRQVFDTGSSDGVKQPSTQLWSQPLSILSIGSLVILMVWSHRAMVVARNLRYPAARGIGWSVAGWMVPIINFWFPYGTLRDLLPDGHPARATVRRWFGCYLVATVGALVVFAAAFVSTALAIAVELPIAVAAALAASNGVTIVDAVLADHVEAVGRVTGAR